MKIRFMNQWRAAGEFRVFCLFNVYKFSLGFGIVLLNFGVEFYRITPENRA